MIEVFFWTWQGREKVLKASPEGHSKRLNMTKTESCKSGSPFLGRRSSVSRARKGHKPKYSFDKRINFAIDPKGITWAIWNSKRYVLAFCCSDKIAEKIILRRNGILGLTVFEGESMAWLL
jgi:hypothetical protein